MKTSESRTAYIIVKGGTLVSAKIAKIEAHKSGGRRNHKEFFMRYGGYDYEITEDQYLKIKEWKK